MMVLSASQPLIKAKIDDIIFLCFHSEIASAGVRFVANDNNDTLVIRNQSGWFEKPKEMASPLAPEIEAAKINAKTDVVFGLLCRNS